MIGLSPTDFWNMSLLEFYLALKGFKEFHGAEKDKPLNRTELDELMELHPDD
jgi:hypothetical protein